MSIKPFKIQELIKACTENRVYEAFGAGTAAIVSPVQQFTFDDKVYRIPIDLDKGAGKLTMHLQKTLNDI